MRFKGVIGALIFIIVASFIAASVFVQTKTFGRVVTRILTDITNRKLQTKVSLQSISISFFPPGVEFQRVRVEKEFTPKSSLSAEFGKLGFYIGLLELEERKFTLGEIRLSDSDIVIKFPENKDEKIERIDQVIIDKIFSFDKKLPIRIDSLLIENSRIFANHELFEAKRLKVFKTKKSFMTRFHIANVNPTASSEYKIDEVWGEAEISKKDINIHRLRIQHDVHTLLLKGTILNYPEIKGAEANLVGESNIHLRNISEIIKTPELIQIQDGASNINFNLNYKDQKVSGSIDSVINNLKSNIIHAEKLVASFDISSEEITLKKFNLSHKLQRAELLNKPVLYNFKTAKFLYDPITVQVEKMRLGNALRFMPSLSSIKGKLTGKLTFNYDGDYYFSPNDGFIVEDLGLVVGDEKPFKVLMAKKAVLRSSNFRVVRNEFQMDSILELPNSLLDVKGIVNKDKVRFKVSQAMVDLEDLGNIANLDIKGKGTLDLLVSGPLDDVILNIKGNTENFEVLGYRLGKTSKDLSIELKNSNVIIHKMEAKMRSTPISGTGVINYDNLDIALGINSTKTTYGDLQEILYPILSKISFLPSDLEMNAKIDASIYGKTTMDKLKVRADVQFSDLVAYGESIDSGKFQVRLENENLHFKDLRAIKGKGRIFGDFSMSLVNDKLKVNYIWEDLLLSNFNMSKKLHFNLDGLITGSINGEGNINDYDLALETNLERTRTSTTSFKDSQISINISPQRLHGSASLLGSIINSDFNYSLDHKQKSQVKVDVDIPMIKPFASAFLGQHLDEEDFSGAIKLSLDTNFKWGFKEMNLEGKLENLDLRYDDLKVSYSSNVPQFLIENSNVKNWNLEIKQPDLFVTTKGNGTFGKNISLEQQVLFNSRIFELLLSSVLSSEGFIKNVFKIEGNGDEYDFGVKSKTTDLDLTLEGIPFPINNIVFDLDFNKNRLVIHEMKASLDNGSAGLQGDVFFDGNAPDVNVKYSFDKAEIPILGKSFVNISGDGIILGNNLPYNVGGEIFINKGQILNELNDFGSKSSTTAQVRFLPPNQESSLGKLFNLNLNFKIDNPVRISNSLMDVSLKGEVRILGNPARPRGEGRLFSPINSSRIFFKNNEYYITNADLNFTPRKDITNPDFDIQTLTFISSYKIYAKAYGDLERFNFDLTSDPVLPRNSILSLIAFGYTDDLQNTLAAEDQQTLTQVGVGSFVFDRFKISDILNKQFGLQVNLGTVFEESQESLISGRASDGGTGQLGRTRSATKIELKKRLDEALTLSVSSTMGGSIGQRQSMNLNYGISKKVQLEGIYELRTNEEGTEDIIDNSIGADLKFRWTFK